MVDGAADRQRVLGVVGTFVLDRIVGLPGRPTPEEGLGGLAYTLAGAGAALPSGWRLHPLARVGADAVGPVRDWLRDADLDTGGIVEVPEANNRVELHYVDDARRVERLRGGVRGWKGGDLVRAASHCDALLVNFISGHELGLDEALIVRESFAGPIYADLHSLFLGMSDDGTRSPRPLPSWDRWMTCFDAIQLNAAEMDLLRLDQPVDRMALHMMEWGPGLVTCTLGAAGAVCWSTDVDGGEMARRRDAPPGHPPTISLSSSRRHDGSVIRHEIPAYPVDEPDPTGCGDVFAGVMCCRRLGGDDVPRAGRLASRMAAAAAERTGVEGLAGHLRALARNDEVNAPEEAP